MGKAAEAPDLVAMGKAAEAPDLVAMDKAAKATDLVVVGKAAQAADLVVVGKAAQAAESLVGKGVEARLERFIASSEQQCILRNREGNPNSQSNGMKSLPQTPQCHFHGSGTYAISMVILLPKSALER